MKKIAAILATVLIAVGAQAQTSKGTVTLSGNFGYSQKKVPPVMNAGNHSYSLNSYTYTLSPALGFFVKDNLQVGASYHQTRSKSESLQTFANNMCEDQSESKGTSYRVYTTHYTFLKQGIAFRSTLSAGMQTNDKLSHSTNSIQSEVYYDAFRYDKISAFSVVLSPGFTFFPSEKVGLTANLLGLSYSRNKVEEIYNTVTDDNFETVRRESAYTTNTLELSFSSMHLNIGLTYFFSK